ncbi:RecB-like helicase [Campylobacter concisus]|uniref:RecB-like helicase n=1 Tax=Campylobacter concisus TaxID=199 RepID=UPI000CD94515|nr:RecB-like helicase [Campylobacter concisus]QPH87449.1 RecB-like helicase [Campylobacter concisus]QPI02395.1 RecB-like helicase [Campylobacter concisus]
MKDFLALKASAGSGKTFALSVRYIALVLRGENINEIIALTFTKKAANEMKERIIATFLDLQNKKDELDKLCKELSLSQDEVIKRRDEKLYRFLQSELKIYTFDAFFSGILKKFSQNLGLSPDYSVQDSLQDLAWKKFVKEASKDQKLLSELALMMIISSQKEASFSQTLAKFYESFGGELKDSGASYPDDSKVRAAQKEINEYIALQNGASDTAKKTFKEQNLFELFKNKVFERESLDYRTFSKIYTSELDRLFNELKEAAKEYILEVERYRLSGFSKLLNVYKYSNLELNKEINALSFADINKLVFKLLVENFDKDVLYFRLDGRINHLLIDEFQDTNVIQYEIILPIINEIVSGYGQNGLGSFFYVGDTKQSIYKFRGGKKELFDKLGEKFEQIFVENLPSNYRSLKALVKFNNAVFEEIYHRYGLSFEPQKPAKKDKELSYKVNGECPYFEVNEDDYGYLRVLSYEDIAGAVVSQVKELLAAGVNASEITVLCWKNSDISLISEVLSSEGIKSINEGTLELKRTPFVAAIIEYAKFCLFGEEIYEKNVKALVNTNPKKLKIKAEDSATKSLFYLAKNLYINMADVDILRLFELSSGYKNLSDFIFNLENFSSKISPKNADGVKIMTVHKSKGLEFAHVIVCDMMSKGRSDDSSFITEYSEKGEWIVKSRISGRENFDPEYAGVLEQIKELEKQENINKIYVAFTRATKSLIIIKQAAPSGNSPSFFSFYTRSDKSEVNDYLDLKEFSFGKILPSKSEQKEAIKDEKMPEILKIERQDVEAREQKTSGKNLEAIYFGLAFHYLLEMSEKFDENSLLKAKSLMLNKFYKFLSPDRLEDAFKRAKMLINEPKFIECIKDKEIYKEQPFKVKNELKQMDLFCIGESEIRVIDYKTTDKNIEENKKQVGEYKEALSKFYPKHSIIAVIFYALDGKISYIEV